MNQEADVTVHYEGNHWQGLRLWFICSGKQTGHFRKINIPLSCVWAKYEAAARRQLAQFSRKDQLTRRLILIQPRNSFSKLTPELNFTFLYCDLFIKQDTH